MNELYDGLLTWEEVCQLNKCTSTLAFEKLAKEILKDKAEAWLNLTYWTKKLGDLL